MKILWFVSSSVLYKLWDLMASFWVGVPIWNSSGSWLFASEGWLSLESAQTIPWKGCWWLWRLRKWSRKLLLKKERKLSIYLKCELSLQSRYIYTRSIRLNKRSPLAEIWPSPSNTNTASKTNSYDFFSWSFRHKPRVPFQPRCPSSKR